MRIAATTNGLLIVLTKLLSNRGVTLPEIYTVRTALAGAVYLVLIPPRGIPLAGYPRLAIRSSLQTAYFVLLIAAVQRGHPATVQTIVATTPLLLLAWNDAHAQGRARRCVSSPPPPRSWPGLRSP